MKSTASSGGLVMHRCRSDIMSDEDKAGCLIISLVRCRAVAGWIGGSSTVNQSPIRTPEISHRF